MPNPSTNPALLASLLDKFAAADCCWFASTRPDGRAHLAPIWHVWHTGAVYVVTKADAVRAENIRHNASVSLSLPDPLNVFVLEGVARFAPEMEEELAPLFQAKYDWDIRTDTKYNAIIAVDPVKAMAWGSHGEGRWQNLGQSKHPALAHHLDEPEPGVCFEQLSRPPTHHPTRSAIDEGERL